jgi:dUTPase
MTLFSDKFDEYMEIKIFVDSTDNLLVQTYIDSANAHNLKLLSNPEHYDAGFDIYLPNDVNLTRDMKQIKVDYNIKCCAHIVRSYYKRATAFYTYGRSSISNTSLRLANNQGIIDAGYRGNLMAKFDVIHNNVSNDCQYHPKYSRLMQICAPGLMPIRVTIVDKLEDLGEQTLRGTGGFGSTGV